MSGSSRPPDFVVAGYTRSGTTWLHTALSRHPRIYLSARKELHYLDRNRSGGLGFYDRYLAGASPGQLTGDVSPTYAEMPDLGSVFAAELPAAKVVLVLRDPCARLPSVHAQLVRDGRYQGDLASLLRCDDGSPSAFLLRQRYASTVGSLRGHLPRGQIGIFHYDQLEADPDGFLGEVLAFLGLEPDLPTGVRSRLDERANATVRPRSAALHRYLQRANRRLRGAHRPWLDRWLDRARDRYRDRMTTRVDDPTGRQDGVAMIRELCGDDLDETSRLIGIDLRARWWPA